MQTLFHRQSTLFGAIAAALIGVAAGAASHWSGWAIALAAIVSFLVLPRLFYGLSAAKQLDAEPVQADSGYPPFFDAARIGQRASEPEDASKSL